jgi:CheY-like chemotaxis protein
MAKILIIDDDQQVCSLVGGFLCRQGHDVSTATNGSKGLEAAAAFSPQLILCDLDMPGIDGLGVVTALRRDERQGEIPIIFLSGCIEHGRIRRTINLGADDFISKTVPLEEILDAVNARLTRHQHQCQRMERQIEAAAEVFVGIIHDLNQMAPPVRWLADAATGMASQKNRIIQRVRQSLDGVNPLTQNVSTTSSPPSSLIIKNNNRREFLKLSEVKALLAEGDYSNVYWGKDQHMLFRKSLKQWHAALPPEQFVRVHRQAIINLKYLDFVEKDSEGKQQIHLREFKSIIPVSQRGAPIFNRCLKKFQMR